MRKSNRLIPKLYLQWASSAGEGMTLELVEAADDGNIKPGGLYPVATILADDAGRQHLELYSEGLIVRIPLLEIERALQAAKEGVHGGSFYDQQLRKDKIGNQDPEPGNPL
jgi:hypothetical protein